MLYVSRSDAKARRLSNTESFEKALQQVGFEIINTKGMSVREQWEIFKDASVVAGLHGAGMANALFSPENTQVIEICNRDYINGRLGAIHVRCGKSYYPIIVEQNCTPGWEIDIDLVVRTIKRCLADYKSSMHDNMTSVNHHQGKSQSGTTDPTGGI